MAVLRVRANCNIYGLAPWDEADVDSTKPEIAALLAAGLLTSLGADPGGVTAIQVGDEFDQDDLLPGAT